MKETIPLLERNVEDIRNQLASKEIRSDWKTTRENYSRIESAQVIRYSSEVIPSARLRFTCFFFAISSLPMCECC